MFRVSVIIPSYNRFKSCCDAIDSVLNQSIKSEIQIIVVDDASTEKEYFGLPEKYKSFTNVLILRQKVNGRILHKTQAPQGLTRMVGIKESKAPYIAFLDDDDLFIDPRKLEMQLQLLKRFPEAKIACSNMWKGKNKNEIFFSQIPFPASTIKDEPYLFYLTADSIRTENWMPNSTILVEKEILLKTGGIIAETFEDFRTWQRILATGCLAIYSSLPTVWYDNAHAGGSHYEYQYHQQKPKANGFQWISKIVYLSDNNHRLLQFQSDLKRMSLQADRFDTIKCKEIECIGQTLSHIEVLQKAIDLGDESLLVMESNFAFAKDVEDIHKRMASLKDIDFDVACLAAEPESMQVQKEFSIPGFKKLLYGRSTCAYIVKKKYMPILLENFSQGYTLLTMTGQHWLYAIDRFWLSLQKEHNWLLFDPFLGYQREFSF
jgi:teichuronic acid biosynthesis glycosyltransferase TuaG